MSVSPEQIAHDLAIVYVTNRHAIDVSGSFYVNSTEGLGGAIDSISVVGTSRPPRCRTSTGTRPPRCRMGRSDLGSSSPPKRSRRVSSSSMTRCAR